MYELNEQELGLIAGGEGLSSSYENQLHDVAKTVADASNTEHKVAQFVTELPTYCTPVKHIDWFHNKKLA